MAYCFEPSYSRSTQLTYTQFLINLKSCFFHFNPKFETSTFSNSFTTVRHDLTRIYRYITRTTDCLLLSRPRTNCALQKQCNNFYDYNTFVDSSFDRGSRQQRQFTLWTSPVSRVCYRRLEYIMLCILRPIL